MSKIIFAAMFSIVLSGCVGMQNKPKITIDAMAAPNVLAHKTYFLQRASKISPGLEFDGYAAQVEYALSLKGLTRVSDINQAETVIILNYGVGQANTQTYTTAIPQWGQTGYSSAQTYGTSYGGQYTANTYFTPTYGVTGYVPVTNSVTTYPLGIFLLGGLREGYGTPQARQLWQISVTTSSGSPDLRSQFPTMLRAAQPYLLGDTGGSITVQAPKPDLGAVNLPQSLHAK